MGEQWKRDRWGGGGVKGAGKEGGWGKCGLVKWKMCCCDMGVAAGETQMRGQEKDGTGVTAKWLAG